MELFERDSYLKELESKFAALSNGGGAVIMISGEAGIGKTSLVENFIKNVGDHANILWGACDDLFTPRPLGPLYDIAAQLNNNLLNLLNNNASRSIIFTSFIQDLQESDKSNIVIFEDVHWADESTLDLIKYLGRRAVRSNSLFVVTYRDDEIGSEHPLRLVLGDIPSSNLFKYGLSALSEKTVNELADEYGIKKLYEITGGNPFLISELLNNNEEGIPSKIQDSIVTRLTRLSPKAKELAELISVIPTRAEKWLIDGIIPSNSELMEECYNSGILHLENGAVSFKHEISRMAAEKSLNESKRRILNKKVLELILARDKTDEYLARIIHHALRIPDKDILIRYSPLAAKQASLLGAHLLAADHYKYALKYAEDIPFEKKLELYEGLSYECYLTGKISEGIKACESIIELLKGHSRPLREGENYRRLARLLWYAGEDFKGEEYLVKAVKILEGLPPGKQLAMAYSNLSQIYMCREKTEFTVEWGKKAIELARKINDLETEAHTEITIGSRKMCDNDDSGISHLMKGLEISLKNDFHEQAARTYNNLGSVYMWRRNLPEAEKYYSLGLEYCSDKDIDSMGASIAYDYARTRMFMGYWEEAIEGAMKTLKNKNLPAIHRIIPHYIIGIIRTRRGDPGALEFLHKANILISDIGEIWEMIVTVKSALAEFFWMQNKLENIIEELESVYNKIKYSGNRWVLGEIAYWLWKCNRLMEISERIAEPYLLQIKGDWKSAAQLWHTLGCPFEQAMALSEGGEEGMKKAVEIFDNLGAAETSKFIKLKLRESGVKNIPKGPRKTTRKNPAGLTSRQMEVLKLLSNGMSNSEIGRRLFISPKTVDHHISAILSKLNIHSRVEAAAYFNSGAKIKGYSYIDEA